MVSIGFFFLFQIYIVEDRYSYGSYMIVCLQREELYWQLRGKNTSQLCGYFPSGHFTVGNFSVRMKKAERKEMFIIKLQKIPKRALCVVQQWRHRQWKFCVRFSCHFRTSRTSQEKRKGQLNYSFVECFASIVWACMFINLAMPSLNERDSNIPETNFRAHSDIMTLSLKLNTNWSIVGPQ